MQQRLALFLAALWWGGMGALSFLAVPTLFAQLGGPVAGPVAARLFSLQAWSGLLIGLALLVLISRARHSAGQAQQQHLLSTLGFVLAAMLLAMVQEFGVAQNIVTARATGGNLRLWHSLGTLMVLGQWLCAGAVLWRLSRPTKVVAGAE